MPTDDSWLITLVLALFGGGTMASIITSWLARRKTIAETKLCEANADNLIIGSALQFVNTLKEEVVDLKKSVETLEKKITLLDNHVRLQSKFISRLRDALMSVKPDHPILAEQAPILVL